MRTLAASSALGTSFSQGSKFWPHLGGNAYAPWVLVIQQQPLGSEAGVIRVVTLCSHVCGIAHHVKRHNVQQCVTGRMQPISERQASILDTLAGSSWYSDVSCLHSANNRCACLQLLQGTPGRVVVPMEADTTGGCCHSESGEDRPAVLQAVMCSLHCCHVCSVQR